MVLIAVIAGVCFAVMACRYWSGLSGPESPLGTHSFVRWTSAGLVLPSVVWVLLHSGFGLVLPPLLPEISWAKAAGEPWVLRMLERVTPGLLVISSYWAAVTFAHLTVVIGLRAEPRREFVAFAGAVALLISPLVWLCCSGGGLPWAGIAALLYLVPVTHCTAFLACKPKPVPTYARAVARLKRGKYEEAEREVIEQLEKRENDFEGWMLLAELYAKQFGDLAEADRTVRALCDEPELTPLQISMGLNRLADWHLHLGGDPVSARRALTELLYRLPGSHSARMAQQRLDQLPASRKEWAEQQQPKKIRLPALTGDLDALDPSGAAGLSRTDAAKLANDCVERLQRNPNDTASRERLATLLAEQLGKTELGLEQIQLLLDMPGQPDSKRAEWLSRLAAWQFRFKQDRAAATRTLQQLLEDYPQSVQAFAAQRWLNLLDMEERSVARSRMEAPAAPAPKIKV